MSVEVLGPYCAKSIEFKIIKLNNNDDMIIMAFEANAHSDIYIPYTQHIRHADKTNVELPWKFAINFRYINYGGSLFSFSVCVCVSILVEFIRMKHVVIYT